jgi:hypothetical protein
MLKPSLALLLLAGPCLRDAGADPLTGVPHELPALVRLEQVAPAAPPRHLAFRFRDEQAAQAPTALLEAALVPGLNPARRGEWVKAGVFVGVELLGFLMNARLEQEGQDLDREFIAYANAHWNIDRYLEDRISRGEFAHEELWRPNPTEEWVNGQGSHVLPIAFSQGGFGVPEWWLEGNAQWQLIPTQQFYEMIGKYAQFQRGWDDYGPDRAWTVTYFSPNSDVYQDKRTASNDKLKAADAWMGLVVANHAVSLLETVIQRTRAGKHLELGIRPLTPDRWPVNTLQIGWSL